MKLARNVTVLINNLMDQLIPPALRDARWFMELPMKLFAGDKADIYMNFKERAFDMSPQEFAHAYEQTGGIVARETDLNKECIIRILASIAGQNLLEAGCGRGALVRQLSPLYKMTACDVVVSEELKAKYPSVTFHETNIEKLPFPDNAFDTVICTHTLEHVVDIQAAIAELRRVAGKRLIVVVPRERPYRYTFSLHLHFFPYKHSLLYVMGKHGARRTCENVGGDWLYIEDK